MGIIMGVLVLKGFFTEYFAWFRDSGVQIGSLKPISSLFKLFRRLRLVTLHVVEQSKGRSCHEFPRQLLLREPSYIV